MNKRNLVGLFASLTLCCLPHNAAAELKIGVVRVTQLLDEAPQAISLQKKMDQEFAPRDRKLLDEQKELKKLEDQLAHESAMISEAERGRAERDIRARKRDLRRALDELREDKTIRINEALAELQRLVNETIREIGKQEGYDLILYEGIIFATPRIDLTNEALKRLKSLDEADNGGN